MKKFYYLLTLFMCVFTSCSTVETFTVHGNPGTKIYTPQKKELATISQNGKIKIQLPSDAYYGYLFTRDEVHDCWVPFALDVKSNAHIGTKAQVMGGYALSSVGTLCLLVGTIAEIAEGGESSTGLAFPGVGGGGALVGTGILLPAQARMGQLAYQYNFGYTPWQQTNSDLKYDSYKIPKLDSKEDSNTRKKATSVEPSANTDSSSAKARKNTAISTAKKKRKTASELIAGEYTGNGTLTTFGEDPETLGTIVVIITPKDEDTVFAEILEDNEAFFESEELFSVTKNKDGSFTLTHTRIPAVKFTINKAGKIDYKHPKVNIDGTTYTLSIIAKKNLK